MPLGAGTGTMCGSVSGIVFEARIEFRGSKFRSSGWFALNPSMTAWETTRNRTSRLEKIGTDKPASQPNTAA
jgi:hypothetical protein